MTRPFDTQGSSFTNETGRRRGSCGPQLPCSTDAIPGLEEVRLAPSMKNRSGAVWSKISVSFPDWEVEMQMRVTGPGRWGALGMVSGPYSYLLGKQVLNLRYQCPSEFLTCGSGTCRPCGTYRTRVKSALSQRNWSHGMASKSSLIPLPIISRWVVISCPFSHSFLTLTLNLLTVPEVQADCHLPCRTALPFECWPVMGMASRSSLGKGLRELTSPFPGLSNCLYFLP